MHWWPWCDEAFAEAASRDVPVFLSVGYAACTGATSWPTSPSRTPRCRVDQRAVRGDQGPGGATDVDAVYMQATQAMTGHGGWPMTVFLTPDWRPLYAGTYFPPTPRHGMPSFVQVATAVAEAWRDRRVDIVDSAVKIVDQLANLATAVVAPPRSTSP